MLFPKIGTFTFLQVFRIACLLHVWLRTADAFLLVWNFVFIFISRSRKDTLWLDKSLIWPQTLHCLLTTFFEKEFYLQVHRKSLLFSRKKCYDFISLEKTDIHPKQRVLFSGENLKWFDEKTFSEENDMTAYKIAEYCVFWFQAYSQFIFKKSGK